MWYLYLAGHASKRSTPPMNALYYFTMGLTDLLSYHLTMAMRSSFSTLTSTDPLPLLERFFSSSSSQAIAAECSYKVDLKLKKLEHQWC